MIHFSFQWRPYQVPPSLPSRYPLRVARLPDLPMLQARQSVCLHPQLCLCTSPKREIEGLILQIVPTTLCGTSAECDAGVYVGFAPPTHLRISSVLLGLILASVIAYLGTF